VEVIDGVLREVLEDVGQRSAVPEANSPQVSRKSV
jgi:hypothetical protein